MGRLNQLRSLVDADESSRFGRVNRQARKMKLFGIVANCGRNGSPNERYRDKPVIILTIISDTTANKLTLTPCQYGDNEVRKSALSFAYLVRAPVLIVYRIKVRIKEFVLRRIIRTYPKGRVTPKPLRDCTVLPQSDTEGNRDDNVCCSSTAVNHVKHPL